MIIIVISPAEIFSGAFSFPQNFLRSSTTQTISHDSKLPQTRTTLYNQPFRRYRFKRFRTIRTSFTGLKGADCGKIIQ